MPNRQSDPNAKVKYLVQQRSGDFVIEIPATWKVTFGAVNPGVGGHGSSDLHCMRVWEGEKLRAVYSNVTGFRDLSIPMARKVQAETRESKWSMDSMGNFSTSQTRQLGEPTFVEEDDVITFGEDEEM